MVKKVIEKVGDIAAGTVDVVTAPVQALTEVMGSLRDVTATLVSPFEELAGATEKMTKAFGGSGGFQGFVEAATAVDSLRANLQQATGQGEKYRDMAIELEAGMTQFGITSETTSKALSTLHTAFSEFTLLAPKAQKELAQQATAFTKLGISIEQSTANYNQLIKGMGFGAKEAKSTHETMAKLALSIGVAPQQMAKDFAAAAPTLARYGKSGIKVFNQLAVQSKATGLSMEKLLSVAGRFDTFEQAADQAGKLNAMLGGNLINSIDMLTASESERIDMIRQSIAMTGQSWESLDRFQKKGIAGAVGITDMADAMRLFGTEQASLDDLKEKADPAIVAQQNLTKAMIQGTSIAERFAAIFSRLGKIYGRTLEPIFASLSKFLTGRGGLGAAESVFRGFNTKLKEFLGWWKQLGGGTKGLIKDFIKLSVKAMAFSFVISQVHSIASPFMDLLTNKWVIIGAGIAYVVTHWKDLGDMMKKAATYLESVDKKIMKFFNRNKKNAFVNDFIRPAYMFFRQHLPQGLRDLADWFDVNKPKMIAFFNDMKKSVGGWFGNLWDDFKGSKGFFQGGMIATIQRWGKQIMNVVGALKGLLMNLIGFTYQAISMIPWSGVSWKQGTSFREMMALNAAGQNITQAEVAAGQAASRAKPGEVGYEAWHKLERARYNAGARGRELFNQFYDSAAHDNASVLGALGALGDISKPKVVRAEAQPASPPVDGGQSTEPNMSLLGGGTGHSTNITFNIVDDQGNVKKTYSSSFTPGPGLSTVDFDRVNGQHTLTKTV